MSAATARPTARHHMSFAASSSGSSPCTWGQRAIWDVLEWLPDRASLNLISYCPAAPGVTMAETLDALRTLIERHDALRTRFTETDAELYQFVAASGTVDVEVFDAAEMENDEGRDALIAHLTATPFDDSTDLPVRPAIVANHTEPVAVVLAVSHVAVDGWSLRIVMEDLERLLQGERLPDRGAQPLDRAGYEQSPRGARREERTLAFWSSRLATVPPVLCRSTGSDPAGPRDWADIDSPAMAAAARRLATRVAVTPTTVLGGATALLLAARTGSSVAAMRVLVGDRFRPDERRLVGAVNLNGLYVVSLTAATVAGYLAEAERAALAAYHHCAADPRRVAAVTAATASGLGYQPGGDCFFNDISFRTPAEGRSADDEPAALLHRTRLGAVADRGAQYQAKFFLWMFELAGSCRLTLAVDPAFAEAGSATGFLRDLERLIVLAADAPGRKPADLLTAIAAGQGSQP